MKLRFLWPILPGAAVVLTCATSFVAGKIAGAPARTRTYFAVERSWATHWPLAYGKYLPLSLRSTLEPFTPVWMQVEPGIRMWLDPNDFVSRTVLETGQWEPQSWRIVEQDLRPGSTFVDVGAHIGYYTLKAATVVGPAGHILAIEPNPETARILAGNVRASNAAAVSIQAVACSDTETTLQLFAAAEGNTGETSLSRANASQERPVTKTYQVRARPLDAIVRESGVTHVDAIKIDVEGAEFLVLRGAQETLTRFHPAILIELLDRQLREMRTSIAEVVAFLQAQGYSIRRQDDKNFEFVAAGDVATRR
jgi:FkbM family methyltransferase